VSEHHVNVQVNLPVALGKLQVQLQRLSDLVSIGVTGLRKVDEAEYQESPFFASVQLASNDRLSFAEIKDEFTYWCLRNSFTDAIDQVSAFMEECRLIARLYHMGSKVTGAEWNDAVVDERRKFHKLGLPDKVTYLRERYGVSSQFEDHILSLNRVRNCLVHRLGIVSAEDVKGSTELVIKWHGVRYLLADNVTGVETYLEGPTQAQNESELKLRIGPIERKFPLKEAIRLSPAELDYSMHTFYVFALEILKAIEKLQPVSPGEGQRQ
jgi:hypothetical protein